MNKLKLEMRINQLEDQLDKHIEQNVRTATVVLDLVHTAGKQERINRKNYAVIEDLIENLNLVIERFNEDDERL